MAARKEAIMNNIKQELAMTNAQELMNVRFHSVRMIFMLYLYFRKLVNAVLPNVSQNRVMLSRTRSRYAFLWSTLLDPNSFMVLAKDMSFQMLRPLH